jgi:hypothetical protein
MMTSEHYEIPGLYAPVFAFARNGVTIDARRRLVRFPGRIPVPGPIPVLPLVEPWSSRIVGHDGFKVFIMTPGTGHFEPIGDEELRSAAGYHTYTDMAILPRRRQTVVVSDTGLPFLVEGKSLKPWMSKEEMASHGFQGIYKLGDARTLSATIIIDLDRHVHVLTDAGEWYEIAILDKEGEFAIQDEPGAGATLLLGKTDMAVRKNSLGDGAPFSAEKLTEGKFEDGELLFSKLFSRPVTYARRDPSDLQPPRWRHLTPRGMEDIPGGDIALVKQMFGNIQDLSAIGQTLIVGRDGLFLYQGDKIVPVRGSGRERVGELQNVRAYDLPSIGRAIIRIGARHFELTRNGTFAELSTKFPGEENVAQPFFEDWPDAGVALVATSVGLFALDRNLNAVSISGSDLLRLDFLDFIAKISRTGEMIIEQSEGLFLVIDSCREGKEACRKQQEAEGRIPASEICLKPVPGGEIDLNGYGGGEIEIIEAPRGEGALINVAAGLFYLTNDGRKTRLTNDGRKRGVPAAANEPLQKLPWSDEAIYVGDKATIIHQDLAAQALAWNESSEILGVFPSIHSVLLARPNPSGAEGNVSIARLDDVQQPLINTKAESSDIKYMVDAAWFGTPLIAKPSGLFSMDRDGAFHEFALRNPGSSALTPGSLDGISDLVAIDRFQTLYAKRDGWHRITKSRQWLPVHGLPDAHLEAFDAGSGKVLLNPQSDSGLFAVDAAGHLQKVLQYRARPLAREAGTKNVLAGTDEGLMRISPASLKVASVPNGSIESIGYVLSMVEIGFADLNIIDASRGIYALEHGKISKISDLTAIPDLLTLSVLPRAHRVISKYIEPGQVLYELGRYDGSAKCTKPVADLK